jgi:predicted esterase
MKLLWVFVLLATATSALAQGVPVKDTTLAGNDKQRYFLIGDTDAKPPETGFGLLLVLPGGDGSADFHPFVKNIQASALPEGYLVAQLVAVPSRNQNQIVWPTAKSKDAKQTFTTESFIVGVVDDVKKAAKIDPEKIFTLSWSSGGPAAYAVSVAKDSPIKGSFVAMSVYLSAQIKPSIANAKGKRYYLFQSPQDQVTKYAFMGMAKKELTAAGASVETADYEGGHGWHGDVFGNIRKGIDWLESKPTKAK